MLFWLHFQNTARWFTNGLDIACDKRKESKNNFNFFVLRILRIMMTFTKVRNTGLREINSLGEINIYDCDFPCGNAKFGILLIIILLEKISLLFLKDGYIGLRVICLWMVAELRDWMKYPIEMWMEIRTAGCGKCKEWMGRW